jgi:hypothetical protein
MRVIVKHPGARPLTLEIESLRAELGVVRCSCMTHDDGVRVWCDDKYLRKSPVPPLNLIRPTDGHPIHGTVIVTGENGPDMWSLDDRQVALWMATMALLGVDRPGAWRDSALVELVPLIHDVDREMFEQLRKRVAFRNPDLAAPWPAGDA